MADILVVNQGSSSIKLSLFSKKGNSCLRQRILHSLSDVNPEEIVGIGHRIVHGGSKYLQPTLIDQKVTRDLEKLSEMAPLHNPIALERVKECLKLFGKRVRQVAVFDTAFHHTLPKYAHTYAIPEKLSKKHSIRAYGFHGINHEALWDGYVQFSKKKQAKIITVHLGSGCSITAIDKGQSIDTSMGFTPMQGLVMGTRSGDIDPGLFEYLCKKENVSITEVTKLLNCSSGLLGLTGSGDMKELLEHETNEQYCFGVDLFCYRIVKYIGAYIAALGGVDAIIFSGGIGENASPIRERIIQAFRWYGILLDKKKNQRVRVLPGEIAKICSDHSTVSLFVMGANENEWIAKKVIPFISG